MIQSGLDVADLSDDKLTVVGLSLGDVLKYSTHVHKLYFHISCSMIS